jgi:putative transposase
MSQIDVWHHSGRRNPATGVLISRDRPTIVFLTVCTLRRSATLARQIYHDALVQAWAEADAWLVGAYVMMPDHIHLFCAPKNEEIAIEQWIAFWKRQFRRKVGPAAPRFQSRGFHHRLRRDENYHQKWEYVRANPVRAGLVKNAEEWKYQGVLNHLPWYGYAHPTGSSARQSLAPPA